MVAGFVYVKLGRVSNVRNMRRSCQLHSLQMQISGRKLKFFKEKPFREGTVINSVYETKHRVARKRVVCKQADYKSKVLLTKATKNLNLTDFLRFLGLGFNACLETLIAKLT